MSLRLVNLMDDFNLGGVARALNIFDEDAVRAVATSSVVGVSPGMRLAPRLDADVIVLHFPPNWRRLLFVASLRARNPGARVIWIEHSYTGSWEALKVASRWRFRLMMRLAYAMADRVVCVSAGQARWLSKVAGIGAVKLRVIHPWTGNPGLDALPMPDFSPDRPLVIGAYGRFAEAKGFDCLISAHRAGLMPGCELLLGGFGEDEPYLKTLAGTAPGIRFFGKVSRVADFLAQCDVVAVPSRWEAYGMVANEAREAGRPILVAPVDGLPEQVGQAGAVIDFADGDAILAGIQALRAGNLAAMAEAGRAATAGCGARRAARWADLLGELSGARRGVASARPARAGATCQ